MINSTEELKRDHNEEVTGALSEIMAHVEVTERCTAKLTTPRDTKGIIQPSPRITAREVCLDRKTIRV